MSSKTICVCDGCGKTCDNYYAEKDWIEIRGSIKRSRAFYDEKRGGYTSDYLQSLGGDGLHFCSLTCLRIALDKKREQDTGTV